MLSRQLDDIGTNIWNKVITSNGNNKKKKKQQNEISNKMCGSVRTAKR